ncbi:AraC family transcriptional regulator [Bremerella cremea]|uniref:AraC family transcriptional regulator n=1 Tax=Bremerella cremea TaxID=1031537 RepID=A0A368KT26_9BACT|nr:AraC family transcriptional regulator [Bremerella cremea]RCS48304.1 AraC family transcriptional regulator [Bremerella cremea]
MSDHAKTIANSMPVSASPRWSSFAEWTDTADAQRNMTDHEIRDCQKFRVTRARFTQAFTDPPMSDYYISLVVNSRSRESLDLDFGHGRFRRPNRIGEIVVAPPNSENRCNGRGPFESLIVSFSDDVFRHQTNDILEGSSVCLDDLHQQSFQDARIQLMIKQLWAITSTDVLGKELLLEGMFLGVVGQMLALSQSSSTKLRPRPSEKLASLPGVIDYMHANLSRKIQLDELAAVAHVSRSQFTRAFRASTGKSPHTFLLELRIEQAQNLIRQHGPELPLQEIAASCGFVDQSHMSKHFRQVTGVSPAVFRDRC